MDLHNIYERAKAHLNQKYPTWSPDLLNKAALSYTAIEGGLITNIIKPNFVPNGLRQICESTGMQINEGGVISNILVEFDAPEPEFLERKRNDDSGEVDKIMKGTMIYPTLSGNFARYSKAELRKAAPTMKNKPVQKDHSFSVEKTFGIVEEIVFKERTGGTDYVARLDPDDPITRKIEKKFVKSVSVGYKAKIVECSICGEKMNWFHEHIPGFDYEGKIAEAVPKDFTYNHLGVVSFPGVTKASGKIEGESDPMGESLDESILNIMVEGFEPYYTQITESMNGVSFMPEDKQKNQYEAALEAEKLKLRNEQLEERLKEAKKTHEDFVSETEASELQSTIDKVIDAEIALKKLKVDGVEERKKTLSSFAKEVLDARLEVFTDEIRTRSANDKKAPKNPKSRVFDSEGLPPDTQTELSGRQVRELQLEWVGRQMFQERYKPSMTAVQTLDDWDMEKGIWRRQLKEYIV